MQDSGPLKVVAVSDSVFHSLHDRFDRNETNVCSGKSDGSNRPLYRDSDGFIRSVEDDACIVRLSHFQAQMKVKGIQAIVKNRHAQKASRLCPGYKFSNWVYASDGKRPIEAVYHHEDTGKKKIIDMTQKLKECHVCGLATATLKRCAGCRKVYYCSSAHQRADWLTHKGACCMAS